MTSAKQSNCSKELTTQGASFVTLLTFSQLRGCMGSLQATRSLIEDVNHNANAAAFKDPRFSALLTSDIDKLSLQISVLGPESEIQFSSEQELLQQLVPGQDGLILTERQHRATFLPIVWEQLQDPKVFLNNLKQKAGLSEDYWSQTIKISRYSTISF